MSAIARHVPSPTILARRVIKVEFVIIRRHFFVWVIVGGIIFSYIGVGSAGVHAQMKV